MSKKIKLLSKRPTIKKLDDLFREMINNRDKVCRKCGKSGKGLQVAHIYSRANRAVRWDEDNAMLLCLRHHLYWAHKSPVEFTEWVKEELGENIFEVLKMRAKGVTKVDLSAVEIYLKQRIKEQND